MIHNAAAKASEGLASVNKVVQDKAFQASAASATTGAVACGASAGAAGLACGAVAGIAVGVVPALFTFGLSIPIGAVVGASAGCILLSTGGAAVGALGGGATGYGLYVKRHQIAAAANHVATKGHESIGCVKDTASRKFVAPIKGRLSSVLTVVSDAKAAALAHLTSACSAATSTYASIKKDGLRSRAVHTAQRAKAAASDIAEGAQGIAKDKSFQATAVSAVGGAVAVGAGGGVAGLATGTVVGAALGIIPALFTFGLSIPMGAVLGGGTGLITGVAAGTTIGATGGAALGYGVHSKRKEIADAASHTLTKVGESAAYAKETATASANYVKQRAAVVRARLVGSSTGGTEGAE